MNHKSILNKPKLVVTLIQAGCYRNKVNYVLQVGIAVDETVEENDINDLLWIFGCGDTAVSIIVHAGFVCIFQYLPRRLDLVILYTSKLSVYMKIPEIRF